MQIALSRVDNRASTDKPIEIEPGGLVHLGHPTQTNLEREPRMLERGTAHAFETTQVSCGQTALDQNAMRAGS